MLSRTKRDRVTVICAAYDALNRPTGKFYRTSVSACSGATASGNDLTTAYDLTGRVTSVTIAGSGQATALGYDTAARLTSEATAGVLSG